ncbi:MAG: hypothetical protein QM271_05865 [Bacillota bacterium]|jgi:hypothetical protein|nr:hypothetical protein [Bacillota bacterium]
MMRGMNNMDRVPVEGHKCGHGFEVSGALGTCVRAAAEEAEKRELEIEAATAEERMEA